jgi:hypothetical protein
MSGATMLKAEAEADTITLATARRRLAKRIEPGGEVTSYDKAWMHDFEARPVSGLGDLEPLLRELQGRPNTAVVRGAIADPARAKKVRRLSNLDLKTGDQPTLVEAPRRWLALDAENVDLAGTDPQDLAACAALARRYLPAEFTGAACIVTATGSHGTRADLRLRLWFWLSRPLSGAEMKRWFGDNPAFDQSVYSAAQLIYTAAPIVAPGATDPIGNRLIVMPGFEVVQAPSAETLAPPPRVQAVPTDRAPAGPRVRLAEGGTAYGLAALSDECDAIRRAPEGTKHTTINRAAFCVGGLVGGGEIEERLALAELARALDSIQASCKDFRAAEKTLDDGFQAGIARPRSAPPRPTDDIGASVAAAIVGGSEAAECEPGSDLPHYPRPHLSGAAASRRLARIVSGWFDRVERHLAAQDWIEAEAERLTPEAKDKSEARIRAKLVRDGMDPAEAAIASADRAAKVAPRIAKRQARDAASALFGHRAASGAMPRIQIKGAAGLGKTQAVIEEYLRRPSLWKRNVRVYAKDLVLCDEFAAALTADAANVPPAPDGTSPRAIVIRGRQSKGMCDPERLKVVEAAQKAGCDSIYRTCCATPAVGNAPASFCPGYEQCGYIAQFMDDAPALRVLAHARLAIREPNDLAMPAADLVIVDESAISALVASVVVDPALLTDRATYDSEAGEEHRIEDAEAIGRAVAEAVAGADAVAALRAVGVEPQHLREAAVSASLAAEKSRPAVWPGMRPDLAKAILRGHKKHEGRSVAAVFAQLARDMEAGRTASIGVEWDALHKARLENGQEVIHPIIRRHGLTAPKAAPGAAPLLLLDADADLAINRRLFGGDLRGFTVPAVRHAYVIQVSDWSVAKSSIAPRAKLKNNHGNAGKLRGRAAAMVQRETADDARVLAISPLQVRRELTGEKVDDLPVWTTWHGAEFTHFGRHLGVNRWADFDTVIIISREELSPVDAERLARAIWADDPTVTLNLPGGNLSSELRRHDLRTGIAPAVSVRVHVDPRVQSLIEITRECAMGQGADRLRLIHRDPAKPARVLVVSNLPVPGLVVDELLTLDEMLSGGTVWQRARAAVPAGVLPLSPDWLTANLPRLFPSKRTAERAVGELKSKPPNGNIYPYCQMAVYSLAGQFRPSKALVAPDVADPQAELARLLGSEVVDFRLLADAKPVAKPVTVAVPPADPEPVADQLPVVASFATLRPDTLPPFEAVLPPVTPAAPVLAPALTDRQRLDALWLRLEAARPIGCDCGCRNFWRSAGGSWQCATCHPAEDDVAAWTAIPSSAAVARAEARRRLAMAA